MTIESNRAFEGRLNLQATIALDVDCVSALVSIIALQTAIYIRRVRSS
jgi:hypothetical protein